MKRTAEEAALTRLSLLDAALLAFEEKGWRGATFEYVSERAGVTRGALNHHFRDKQALLSEALEWGWAEYGHRLFADVDENAALDGGDALEGLLTHFVRLLVDDARFRALASTTVLVAPQALGRSGQNDALDGWHERIAHIVTDADQVEGSLPAQRVASLVLVLLQGFTVTAVTRPDDLPRSDELASTVASLVRGLLGS
ncbi:TetR/AcrR family transcriptional regulator [Oerskovia jenensis]|uniref:TetR/AcrR family acrAB operon transcriptional repressor n=1 Tax=Oerskovia jenensis TaxID=162169 RepID=A0ABS2LKG0_9CELL|nr:TetR/AcrR family transcriptional regulator [Oerskovia jenensis]MBM7480923.1 TetR/AcrR family acrAB operon transcriptional repressor [Oerskovia jenensis]